MMGVLMSGCVAQQADVVRIKRELDGKIQQLNASRTQLQRAVVDAQTALHDANAIIAQQRGEIQELLHARAELMDQVTTLKDGDLSRVRGELETQAHQVRVVASQVKRVAEELQASRHLLQQHVQSVEPLLKDMRVQLANHEEVLTDQGAKAQEFRQALLDFQAALTTLRDAQRQHLAEVVTIHQRLETQITAQAEESRQLTKALEEVKTSLPTIVAAVEEIGQTLTKRVTEQDHALASLSDRVNGLHTPQARIDHQQRQLERMTRSMTQLRDAVHAAMNRIGERVDAHEEELARLQRRQSTAVGGSNEISALAALSQTVVTEPMEAASAPSSVLSSSGPAPEGAWEEYQRHRRALKEGRFVEALRGFSDFLVRYADSPLAANAQYWLGECYYGQRQFQQAIVEFERVFTLYPKSDKVAAALLKIGYSHLELKDPATAKAVFRQLVRLFPNSPEAAKAYARMAEQSSQPKSAS